MYAKLGQALVVASEGLILKVIQLRDFPQAIGRSLKLAKYEQSSILATSALRPPSSHIRRPKM